MALLPYKASDPFVDRSSRYMDVYRPWRFWDDHFGSSLVDDDFWHRDWNRWPFNSYYRPTWDVLTAAHGDAESKVNMDENKFQVDIDVHRYDPEEITVKTSGGNTITVEGRHVDKRSKFGYENRQFMRKYVLPRGHDADQAVSKLSSDGMLTVTVPRTDNKYKYAIESGRHVPIKRVSWPSWKKLI